MCFSWTSENLWVPHKSVYFGCWLYKLPCSASEAEGEQIHHVDPLHPFQRDRLMWSTRYYPLFSYCNDCLYGFGLCFFFCFFLYNSQHKPCICIFFWKVLGHISLSIGWKDYGVFLYLVFMIGFFLLLLPMLSLVSKWFMRSDILSFLFIQHLYIQNIVCRTLSLSERLDWCVVDLREFLSVFF